jgi:hypothetical protein
MPASLVGASEMALESLEPALNSVGCYPPVHLQYERKYCGSHARELAADGVGALERPRDFGSHLHRVQALLCVVPRIVRKSLHTRLGPHLLNADFPTSRLAP